MIAYQLLVDEPALGWYLLGVIAFTGAALLFALAAAIVARDSFAWLWQVLRTRRSLRRIAGFKARLRRGRLREHTVAVSERERLNVIVRIADRRARS